MRTRTSGSSGATLLELLAAVAVLAAALLIGLALAGRTAYRTRAVLDEVEDALRRLGPGDAVYRTPSGLRFVYRAGETLEFDLPAGAWEVEWPAPGAPGLRTDGYVLYETGGGSGGLAAGRLCVRPRPRAPGVCWTPWGAVVYREAAGPPSPQAGG